MGKFTKKLESQVKYMLTQENLFAKALLAEKPWFVDKVQFDQVAGKLDFSKVNPYYVTHSKL